MSFDQLVIIATNLVALGAVYGGIKAELRGLTAGVLEAKHSAERAHARMDQFFEQKGTWK